MINVMNGSKLADFQDAVYIKLRTGVGVTRSDIAKIKGNMWVTTAATAAPGNLVIRHYALYDMVTSSRNKYSKMLSMIQRVSDNCNIWFEGYSYWLYTRKILRQYVVMNPETTELLGMISSIDDGFQTTAYIRDGKLYPAPFGDLRDIPLDDYLQDGMKVSDTCCIGPVCKSGKQYRIEACPLGMNTHSPSKSQLVAINDKGQPEEFKFYTGYDKKYSNWRSEWGDMLRWTRFKSIFGG